VKSIPVFQLADIDHHALHVTQVDFGIQTAFSRAEARGRSKKR